MDVASFNKLKEKIAPHLPKINEDMTRVNRKAGPVSHEVTLAITAITGSAMDDLWLVYRPICKSRAYTALWDGIAAINEALVIDYPYDSLEKMRQLEVQFRAHTRQQEMVGIVGARTSKSCNIKLYISLLHRNGT